MLSDPARNFELMFERKRAFNDRAADAADLMIDFATLGEYGLIEEVDRTKLTCEGRIRRGAMPRATGSWNSAIRRFSTQS